LQILFDKIDDNKNGYIEFSEFKDLVVQLCHTWGESVPEKESVDSLLKTADIDWDGKISYQEYLDFMRDFPVLFEMHRN
jgi:Ca2+-binding EF-hand superfamily protein